jgi:hypothetical protein
MGVMEHRLPGRVRSLVSLRLDVVRELDSPGLLTQAGSLCSINLPEGGAMCFNITRRLPA